MVIFVFYSIRIHLLQDHQQHHQHQQKLLYNNNHIILFMAGDTND